MPICVFDLESNGLYDSVDTIWCGVFKETTVEGRTHTFRPTEMKEMFTFMDTCEKLIGHNVINYDFPALKKVHGYTYKGEVFDTFVASSLLHPDRFGGHSVANWATLLKFPISKVEHDEWDVFSEAMLNRCTVDVDIQTAIYKAVVREMDAGLPLTDWNESMELEHDIARVIADQEHVGVPFNVEYATDRLEYLNNLLSGYESKVADILGHFAKAEASIKTVYKKNGDYFAHIEKRFAGLLSDKYSINGEFTGVSFQQVKTTMYGRVKNRLMELGWKPLHLTPSGAPKTPSADELSSFSESINSPEFKVLALVGSANNRANIIRKWLEVAESNNGSLPAGAFTNGTPTGRFKHTVVVNVPRASSNKKGELIFAPDNQPSFFGTEMRSFFYTGGDPNLRFVGSDAAGIELRCLAHYINKPSFTETLLAGDIHTAFWQAVGEDLVLSRSDQKSVTYAFLYGAGDKKLGSLLTALPESERTPEMGGVARAKLLRGIEGLGDFVEAVTSACQRGFLHGLDGRRIYMRRNSRGQVATHKALNTLMQGAASVIVKKWTSLVNRAVDYKEAQQRIHMHDEMQFISTLHYVPTLTKILKEEIIHAGELLQLNLPLAADVDIGYNWAETH